jgi:hypothetical protein
MLKGFRNKIAFSGKTVLGIGLALLIFTFVSAYLFLNEGLTIIASQDLGQTFGEALIPLIATSVRVMYLGVMGWIGSLITIRGVTLMSGAPKTEMPAQYHVQVPVQAQAKLLQPELQPKPIGEAELQPRKTAPL